MLYQLSRFPQQKMFPILGFNARGSCLLFHEWFWHHQCWFLYGGLSIYFRNKLKWNKSSIHGQLLLVKALCRSKAVILSSINRGGFPINWANTKYKEQVVEMTRTFRVILFYDEFVNVSVYVKGRTLLQKAFGFY